MFSLFSLKSKTDKIKEALEDGAVIVDVRTPQEFKSGHIKGSINIPLQQLNSKVDFLKKKEKTIITCCLSGGRSASAKSILTKHGIPCINGGGWGSLNYKLH